jgi:cytochrome c peroxidase
MGKIKLSFLLLMLAGIFFSCEPETTTTPYDFQVPVGFIQANLPASNPMTLEGVALGRQLFYDPKLSKNDAQSCADCHTQSYGFTDDGLQFSIGVDGIAGNRNSMPLINLAWENKFFWDGRSNTLEEQIFGPVVNPIEMNISWPEVESKLNADANYKNLFKQVFNIDYIDSVHVSKAIAQFLRTMVSGNSKYDKFVREEVSLTTSELNGLNIYNTERGDCFHCHTLSNGLATDNSFKNNGLDDDASMTDLGRMLVTGSASDKGKFKVPTLRNIEFTAPYMHDGRFATLEEVVDHYDQGGVSSSTVDPLMKHLQGSASPGLNLTLTEKQDLVNFLKTLSDPDFISNMAFTHP